jgi:hypothetical protein
MKRQDLQKVFPKTSIMGLDDYACRKLKEHVYLKITTTENVRSSGNCEFIFHDFATPFGDNRFNAKDIVVIDVKCLPQINDLVFVADQEKHFFRIHKPNNLTDVIGITKVFTDLCNSDFFTSIT